MRGGDLVDGVRGEGEHVAGYLWEALGGGHREEVVDVPIFRTDLVVDQKLEIAQAVQLIGLCNDLVSGVDGEDGYAIRRCT